jgi:hypothetical protein
MAAQRRQQRLATLFAAFSAVIFGCVLAATLAVHAATTERVVTDRHTGLAISGFDPVAYFTDAVPRLGRSDFELASSGVTWRFRNEGNMAAFAADPEIYAPQFGGYDPVGVARGVATAGHPQVFLIHGKRLYLFQSAETRARFTIDPDAVRFSALEKWPDVQHELIP